MGLKEKLSSRKVPERMSPTLDTKDGYVYISKEGNLSRGPGNLHGLRTTLLNDDRPRTAAELEVIRGEIRHYFTETFSLFEKLHDTFVNSPAFYRSTRNFVTHPYSMW